jgi:hypothetical protein
MNPLLILSKPQKEGINGDKNPIQAQDNQTA